MIKDDKLKNIETIYKAIYHECEISLCDIESYDHNFSKRIVNISSMLFNYAFNHPKSDLFTDLPDMSIDRVKTILKSIYEIITGIYFYSEKEQKFKELLEEHSLDNKKLYNI